MPRKESPAPALPFFPVPIERGETGGPMGKKYMRWPGQGGVKSFKESLSASNGKMGFGSTDRGAG
jgi:hypothetical protein